MPPKNRKLPTGIDWWNGRYRVRVYWQYTQVYVGSYESLKDARAALEIARHQVIIGTFVPPAERRRRHKARLAAEKAALVTVRDFSSTWLDRLEDSGRSPGTIVTYESALRKHILPALGDVALSELDRDMLTAFTNSIETRGARDNAARVLRSLLNHAVEEEAGGLKTSPFRYSRPKRSAAKIYGFSDDTVATAAEIDALADAMPPALALAVPLAAWCALRAGEVLGLERRDFTNLDDPAAAWLRVARQVNSKAKTITEPKSDSGRDMAVPEFIVDKVSKHLAEHVEGDPTSPLFPGTSIGKRVSQSSFDRHWRAARDQVKPGMRFHDLRHTGLTYYAHSGATLAELMRRGGHQSVDVAMRYQRPLRERDSALANQMRAAREAEEKNR